MAADGGHPRFRFGVASGGTLGAKEWRDLARRAEGTGFDVLSMTDHLRQPMAPFTALAMAASVTTTVRLGTYVMCQDQRNPVLLAKEFATLDLLSGGRAEIGLGAGWRLSDYTATGTPFGSGPQRLDRFTESVDIVSQLLTGATVTYHGDHYAVAEAVCSPVPARRVPLLIGGSRRRLLHLAARRADTVSIAPSRYPDGRRMTYWDAEIDERIRGIRATQPHRPEPPEIDLALHECHVVAHPEATIRRLSAALGIPPERMAEVPSVLVGTPEQVIDTLLARRERWGASRVTIPASALEALAPVVACLAGT